jgi:hypothetical protein
MRTGHFQNTGSCFLQNKSAIKAKIPAGAAVQAGIFDPESLKTGPNNRQKEFFCLKYLFILAAVN